MRAPRGLLGLFWLADRGAVVAVIDEAYGFFDESGCHAAAKILTVGGWVATLSEWEKFERQWRLALKREGVSEFHFTDFDNNRGEYRGWSKERKEGFIKRIFKVLDSRDLKGFSGAIHIPDFKEVTQGSGTQLEEKPSPYLICQQYCIEMISKTINQKVYYVFDQQLELDHPAVVNFYQTKNRFPEWGEKMAGISFQSKSDFVELQAADLLAYETAKSTHNRFFDPTRPVRKSMLALVRKRNRLVGGYIDKDCSRTILDWQTNPRI
jgi:hypothetical protein